MKCQLVYEDLPVDLMEKYIRTLGSLLEIIPGIGFIETNIDTMDELYTMIERANKITNQRTKVSISILDKTKDEDESILIVIFKPNNHSLI